MKAGGAVLLAVLAVVAALVVLAEAVPAPAPGPQFDGQWRPSPGGGGGGGRGRGGARPGGGRRPGGGAGQGSRFATSWLTSDWEDAAGGAQGGANNIDLSGNPWLNQVGQQGGSGGNRPGSGSGGNRPGSGSGNRPWSGGGSSGGGNRPGNGGGQQQQQQQRPNKNPSAIAGVRPPSTPRPNCGCQATGEYNPVCGTDGATYSNMSSLRCSRICGKGSLAVKHPGACTTPWTTPRPN